MNNKTIAFIGAGNMACSLIGGLIRGGWNQARIRASDPHADRRDELGHRFGIVTGEDNAAVAAGADAVVLAVKPQVIRTVTRELARSGISRSLLVISIAAGVREPDIRRWLGFEAPVVRAMPNTPALVGCGATGLFANPFVSRGQRNLSESILRAVGMTLWVEDETLLDAVTALSGSGPAYFFLLLEMMQATGIHLGLQAETARLLALETGFGAAKMALESPEDPATLRARVTSPGGTTERAIAHLEHGGIRELFREALEAARNRSAELGQQLGRD